MRKFIFACRCRESTHNVRDVLKFLKLIDPALGYPDWTQDGTPLTVKYLNRQIERSRADDVKNERHTGLGLGIVLLTKNKWTLGANFRLFKTDLCLGGDFFSVSFSDEDGLPDSETLLRSLKIVSPAMAQLKEFGNCDALQEGPRARSMYKPGEDVTRIWMVHWFQYLDKKNVEHMGGLHHVLKMPAFKVEKFLDGVYWQLTEEYFQPDNPQHLEVQRAAMEHFGIWDFTPEAPFPLAERLKELPPPRARKRPKRS